MSHLSSMHHSFDIALAAIYGTNPAILIHHFQHWIKFNKSTNRNFHEGRTWTYQSLDDIAAHFPYLNKSRIFDILEKLCEGKGRKKKSDDISYDPVLMKGNFNKSKFDRTVWYAFVNEELWNLGDQNHMIGNSQSSDQDFPTPIPDTKPHTEPDKKIIVPDPAVAVSGTKKMPAKKELPKEAEDLSRKLLDQVLRVHPKFKMPNMQKWAEEMERLNRIDGRTWQEISAMLDWAAEHQFWYKVLQSPDKLRSNWDKMALQGTKVSNRGMEAGKNKELAWKIKNFLAQTNEQHQLLIYQDSVSFQKNGESVKMDLPHETFKSILFKWFDITGEKKE